MHGQQNIKITGHVFFISLAVNEISEMLYVEWWCAGDFSALV